MYMTPLGGQGSYMQTAVAAPPTYSGNGYIGGAQHESSYAGGNGYLAKAHYDRQAEQHASESVHAQMFIPDDFLTGVPTRILNSQEELLPLVEEAFVKTTGQALPDDIVFTVCNEQALAKAYGPGYQNSIQGFCKNRFGWGTSEIFVKQSDLAHTMLTLGHEIGHALTRSLPDARDEEAKAFAFSLAWIETVKEHNIGGIAHAIHPRPAENGLHNVAFDFLMTKHAGTSTASEFMQTFIDLAKGTLSIIPRLETIVM